MSSDDDTRPNGLPVGAASDPVYHVRIEQEDDWYILETVEDPSIFSQSRTLDEAVLMIRDVLDLMKDEKRAELRLIIPADLLVDDNRLSGRITHPVGPEDEWDAEGEDAAGEEGTARAATSGEPVAAKS